MKTNYYVLRLLALSSILFSAGCNNQTEPTDEDVNVEEITLNEKSLSLFKGDTVTLSATVKPLNATNKEVTWESKDTSIATVDKGYVTAIKEGSTSIEVRSVSNKEVFAVCTVDVLSKGTEDDTSVTFKSKTMPTFRYSTSQTGDTNVFFREDKLTQLPYISLKTFYSLLIGKNLTIIKLETDKYKVTSPNGEEALINTKDNTLECADLENFISSSIFRQDNITNVYFDGAPFVRVNKVEKDRTPHKTIIDFEKYGINLFGREDDIILPLVTASNLFEGPTMITCFYNKDEIIFIDPNDPLCDTRTFTTREYYGCGLGASGYINGVRYTNTKSLTKYLKGEYKGFEEKLTLNEEIEDFLMLNLRLKEGFKVSTFINRFHFDPLEKFKDVLQKQEKEGLITINESIKPTEKGLKLLDFLLRELFVLL